MELISVIIPVYNVEKHIRECLDSVINQTYKNLEIILVENASTDLSGEICNEYAKKDSRIKVIHKKIKGVSDARNEGLDIAKGKYIMFLDADDYYEQNACERLLKEIKEKDADYVTANYIHITHDGKKWNEPLFDVNVYDDFKLSIQDYKKSFFVMNSVIWNKIFRREFIENNKLRFVSGAIAEDAIFATFCYVHSDRGYYIKDVIYNYRQNEANVSISTSCTKEYFENLNRSYKLIFDNFNETNNLGFYRFFYARIMPYLLCKIIDTNALKSDEEMIYVLEMLNWFFRQRDDYNVIVISERLSQIVDNIINKNYEEVLINIKDTKAYRNSINDEEKEKMYAPSEELYTRMSDNDSKCVLI